MSEAKDWAGELISGQTGTGRILVSQLSFLGCASPNWKAQAVKPTKFVCCICKMGLVGLAGQVCWWGWPVGLAARVGC